MATAFAIAPPRPAAHYYIGVAFNRNHQYREAARWLRDSVDAEPDFAPAWHALGVAQLKSGMYNDAVTSFRRSLELDRGGAQAHISLIAALAVAGRTGEAERELDAALDAHPDNKSLLELKRYFKRINRPE